MIHQSPIQTLCFWVVCPLKTKDRFSSQTWNIWLYLIKDVWYLFCDYQKQKRKLTQHSYWTLWCKPCYMENLICKDCFVQFFFPFLGIYSSYSPPTISVQSTWRYVLFLDKDTLYSTALIATKRMMWCSTQVWCTSHVYHVKASQAGLTLHSVHLSPLWLTWLTCYLTHLSIRNPTPVMPCYK